MLYYIKKCNKAERNVIKLKYALETPHWSFVKCNVDVTRFALAEYVIIFDHYISRGKANICYICLHFFYISGGKHYRF